MNDINGIYPELEDAIRETKLNQSNNLREGLQAFWILRRNTRDENYIDLYITSPYVMKQNQVLRFILSPNKRMPKEMEYHFNEILDRFVVSMDISGQNKLRNALKETFKINMSTYEKEHTGRFLKNLYHRLVSQDEVAEILSASGLMILADESYRFENLNRKGKTPTEIFNGLPNGLLEIFNRRNFVDDFVTQGDRGKALEVYIANEHFLSELPNKYQWDFLKDSVCLDVSPTFKKKAFETVEYSTNDLQYENYLKFCKSAEKLKDYYSDNNELPNIYQGQTALTFCDGFDKLVIGSLADYEQLIKDKRVYRNYVLLDDYAYDVIVPIDFKQFTNDVFAFCGVYRAETIVSSLKNLHKDIIYLHEKDKPAPKAIIFVEDDYINSVYSLNEAFFSEEEIAFLKRFAKVNGLILNDKIFDWRV